MTTTQIPAFKQEAIDVGTSLIKAASEDASANRYLIEETGRELIKLASAVKDTVTSAEVAAMTTLEKSAAIHVFPSASVLGPMTKKFTETLGAGGAGLVLGLGALAALKAASKIGEIRDYGKYRDALNTAYRGNEMLAAIPEEGIRDIGESIYRFAPKASQDPNLLKNILNTYAASGGVNGGLEGPTIRMLTEIEDRLTKRNQSNVSGLKI